MPEEIPKAVKVEMVNHFLRVTFENGQVKFIRSHQSNEADGAHIQKPKGLKQRLNALLLPNLFSFGPKFEILDDGTVTLWGEYDSYSREELWNDGIDQLSDFNDKKDSTNKENSEMSTEVAYPKAVSVAVATNYLVIKFENGQTRYLSTHFIKDYIDAWDIKKGKGKRINLLVGPTINTFNGQPAKVQEDGSILMYNNDVYSPKEIWENSKDHIYD